MSEKVEVHCPCGEPLRVQVETLGKHGKCPACGERFLIWSDAVAKTAADRHWYVQMDGRARGPVTFVQLRRLVSEGRVTRDTLVRYGREGDWIAAHEARGDIEVAVPKEQTLRASRRRGRARRRKRATPVFDPQHVRLAAAAVVVTGIVVLYVLVAGGNGNDDETARMSTAQIAARTVPSVGVVRGRRGSGSGFMVASDTLVTNYHVIERELLRNVEIHFPNAREGRRAYTPKLRYADPSRDLAFLTIDAEVDPLELADAHEFEVGQEILVVGSPGLGAGRVVLQNAVARGLLSTKAQFDGQLFYQLDVSVNPGNSGGPVVDQRGQVIGVVAAKATQGEHLAFAVPLSELQMGLAHVERTTEAGAATNHARHRLRVAELSLLAMARIYHRAMAAYARALDPQGEGGLALGALLRELDRRLLSDLRLEERAIGTDPALRVAERERFKRLWGLFARLKSGVDEPEGTFREYAAACNKLGEELQELETTILPDSGR